VGGANADRCSGVLPLITPKFYQNIACYICAPGTSFIAAVVTTNIELTQNNIAQMFCSKLYCSSNHGFTNGFKQHRSTSPYADAAYCRGLSVGLSFTVVSPAKTVEPIVEIPFRLWSRVA